ncbi:hypothetical protein BU24DRAFT_433450 [Aaosphaeria arxii CBS 175.79]|uniref:Uncharacterized protein n=1 Tax=Aaosphaeria arxii CBS 175.79 TaxID=1450172 RepID=A0A6A5XV17_9PLEO|nr:uncharacterized protein BU24DRAFT_433450 [Aaosphaeria arxii CBS 175.79]KAF2016470.1 hypothetical protein BU24DRAFT_433450 [Aaosphaeria arxii CBS 175.79]
MSPINSAKGPSSHFLELRREMVPKPQDPDALILEAWSQGYLVGSLIIMSVITMANMRRGVLLHKLILGIWQGFWLFFRSPVYAWWLSVSAIFLNMSWVLHNVISWLKIKPFLSKPVSLFFIGTVILSLGYWILEIYANFTYFHGINDIFVRTRPWEALCRDPWWIFVTVYLFWIIMTQYELSVKEIIRISPRFGIMLGAMIMSIIFLVLDICSVTGAFQTSLPVGINPFWKLAFVFKCLTDMVVLDDFKTALDRLRAYKLSRMGSYSQDTSDRRVRNNSSLVKTWEQIEQESQRRPAATFPSPDGDYVDSARFPGMEIDHIQSIHRDSVVSPGFPRHDTSESNIGPEDLVPSALNASDLTRMESAHYREMERDRFDPDWRAGRLSNRTTEGDYAQALRDLSRSRSNQSRDLPSPRNPP